MKIVDVIKVLSDADIYVFLEKGKLKTRSRENALSADLIELIKNNKQELLDYLSRHENTILFNEGVITPYDGTEPALSFSQQRYWLMDQIESNIGQRNLLFTLKLSGELDLNILDRVFSSLVDRHHILRTQFLCTEKDNPIQVIREEYDFVVVKKDFSKLDIAERELAISQVIDEEHARRFDLNKDLMLRVQLLHVESKQYILIVTIHHVAADGWSVGILIDEFTRLYGAYKLSLDNPLVPLGIKYADYAHWQHQQVNEQKTGALDFWRGELSGAPEKISLPADYILRGTESSVAGISRITIERTLIDQFKNKLFAKKGTLFAGLFASLNVLLYRWCAQQDLVVGVVDAGRDRKEVERIVGCFVNALAIRTKISAFESLGDLLENVCTHLLDVAKHKFFPFEKVVEELNPDRIDSTNPFFNVALLLQNFADSSWDIKDLHVDVLPALKSKAFLDLRFVAWETEQGLLVECEYREELFSARTIDALLDSYRMVVEQFVNCEQRTIDSVEISNDLFLQAQSINYRKKTICAVGTFTLDPLTDSFAFLQKKLSLDASLDLLPFQQVLQQLLDSNSEFRKNKNGFNIVLLGLQDWLGVGDFIQQEKNLHDTVHRFCSALDETQRMSSVPYIVMLCPSCAQICGSDQLISTIDALHKKIAEQFSGSSKVKVLMPAELVDDCVDDCFDYETYQLAHIPYTPIFYSALMSRALRAFNAVDSKPYKVIVLDCDNTIWKGVCAEDGPLGVVVSEEHLYLQKFVVEMQEKGFLLCLCSKNEEGDVWAVFDENNDMHIKREHIISSRINWEPKWKNIYSIADELNLGLESIVFIDDDLSQCLEMRMHCPDVLTIQLPAAVDKIPNALRNIWAFDVEQAALTGNRTVLYEQQNKRAQFLIEHKGSRQDFLESLGVNIDIKTLSADNCDRAVELLARTNQFNLNGYLVNKSDLLEGLDNYIFGVTARVEDRFGDYGLVGLVLFTYKNNNLSLLNMVLSCRALGRGVEYELLKAAAAAAFERNIVNIEWSFVPSARNTPVFKFLSQLYGAIAHAEPANLIPNRKNYCCLQTESILNLNYLDVLEREDSAQQLPALASHTGGDSLNVLPGRWLSSAQYNQIFIWMNDFNLFHQSVADWTRDSVALQRASEQQNYVAPVTNIEKRLCELWGDILGVEPIGVTDNFFKMGGNSLLATRLIANINRSFDVNLQLNLLFSAQTISALAVLIENNEIIARMALDKKAALLPNEVELSI